MIVADKQYQNFKDPENEQQKMIRASMKVFNFLLKEAQDKINQRRRHISSLKILYLRFSSYLYKQLVIRLNKIRDEELVQYKVILLNIQMGLGNHEIKQLVNQSTQVVKMKAIIGQQDA